MRAVIHNKLRADIIVIIKTLIERKPGLSWNYRNGIVVANYATTEADGKNTTITPKGGKEGYSISGGDVIRNQ